MRNLEPKKITFWIEGDVYRAMLIAKARGGGSLENQINEALRQNLDVSDLAELEAREREGWMKKPWSKEDQTEVETWQAVQVSGSD